MGKHNKTGRNSGSPRYVQLFHFVLESEAWKDLNGNERAIYLELARRYNGQNNGKIAYSTRQAAEDLRIGKGTAARALYSLQRHGFIAVERVGAFSLKIRHASEYRLTAQDSDLSANGKTPASKDFMRWKKQNTVPPQVPTGSSLGPNGVCNGTDQRKNHLDGVCNGTVEAV